MTLAFYIIWIAAAITALWVSRTQTIDDVMWWHLRTVTPITLLMLLVVGVRSLKDTAGYRVGLEKARRDCQRWSGEEESPESLTRGPVDDESYSLRLGVNPKPKR